MRKIEQEMLYAIRQKKNWQNGNTRVEHTEDGRTLVYLHSNLIAELTPREFWASQLSITLAGWNTPTTRSRLTAIVQARYPSYCRGVGTKLGQAYIAYANFTRPIDDNEWVQV